MGIENVLSLLCGVALFLFGMSIMGDGLKRVADHCSNIAVAMIELEMDSFDTHGYLNSLREVQSDSFDRFFEMYKNKYDLTGGDFSTGIYDLSKTDSSPRSSAKAQAPASISSRREP